MPMMEKMPASTLNDIARLSVLRDLAILDTPAEPAYDDIAMSLRVDAFEPR